MWMVSTCSQPHRVHPLPDFLTFTFILTLTSLLCLLNVALADVTDSELEGVVAAMTRSNDPPVDQQDAMTSQGKHSQPPHPYYK